ncbi:PEP/pyruvate-binding domain-containing protein [Pendulispora albinea]|uniref:Phosphoenolpyruvate synthase n=1 Tax=Pendulispora albinea TaxID=2741071 RepID=A0ABZ2LTD7_9BACT
MSSPWLTSLETLARKRGGDDARAIGGKAARLVWLVKHGFPVPEAWIIGQQAFQATLRELSPGCDPRSLLRAAGGRSGSTRAAEARQELLNAPLPKGLEEELDELWQTVGPNAPWGLAVRSSATCEDGALVSMAGLAETCLAVQGKEALAHAVREVWASIASGRALAYLAAHGVRDVSMGVVVQRMVQAEAAGVMFTRAPEPGGLTKDQRIVNAAVGLGSPVVDGVSTPDMLRIDAHGRLIEAVIARKLRALVVVDGTMQEITVQEPDRPALGPARVEELADVASRLEKLDVGPWDVEFACDAERTWVVQARPITGHGFPEGGNELTVWSNVNVGEALPGVATPLTWSVAGDFSEAGFRRAFAALGCSVPRHARLVGNVYGRFYLNLTQFMRIAAQVPWLDPRTLVELAGGSGGEEVAHQVADVSRRGFYARFPLTASRLLREQLRLDADVNAFEEAATKAEKAHNALDLAILPDEGLARTIRDVQGLLERTGTVMLTCASSALGTHLALKAVLSQVAQPGQSGRLFLPATIGPLAAERLAQALTAGIRDLESARPAIGMMRIAELARREPMAFAAIDRESTVGLDAIPDGPTRRALQNFLELYGDRAVREAELSTPRWREDVRPVLTMLRVAIRGQVREVESSLARARAHADAEMIKLMPRLGIFEQTLLRHLVARAQKAARLRERMRTWVTRVLGMLREVFLDADRRLLRLAPELLQDQLALQASRSPLAGMHSVFFLTVDEIVRALEMSRRDLAPLVRARRADFARDQARPDPPATFIGAPPPVVLPPSGGDLLRGVPASAGVVEGRARVIIGAERMGELEPGEVLIVHTTDVGWTPLFLMAAGVVTELGGPLSHAAVVAREFGVPSVVSVVGATRVIRTGDRVRVDGDRGVVERLRDATSLQSPAPPPIVRSSDEGWAGSRE